LAGHPSPLRFRYRTKEWEIFETKRESARASNLPLGIMDGVSYGEKVIDIETGDMILAFTDGLTETSVADGQLLGTDGLLTLVQSLDPARPEHLLSSLLVALRELATAPPGDDLTVILTRANGSGVSLRNNLLAPFRLFGGSRDKTRFRGSFDGV